MVVVVAADAALSSIAKSLKQFSLASENSFGLKNTIGLKCHSVQLTALREKRAMSPRHKNANKNNRDDRRSERSDLVKEAAATISLSKFHDISHLISQDMPVYPGEPEPEFHPILSIGKDKVNVTRLEMGSHTGTHVDAPKHFISAASAINDIPLQKFIGECSVVDMSAKAIGHGITDSDLERYAAMMRQAATDILLIYTGTSDQWGKNEDIRTNFSYLEPSAAQWLVDHDIKCVGIDSFSMEKYGFQRGLTHEILLSNGVAIIEGISSKLKEFVGKKMFLVCLPLPLKCMDGSPVRPVLFDVL
ncbi:MAG TPA: cyclase family protein [Nitrososphaera sp.]|nr:cyclase family protein [Nitrososphaera sp.]